MTTKLAEVVHAAATQEGLAELAHEHAIDWGQKLAAIRIDSPESLEWAVQVGHVAAAQKRTFENERDRFAKPLRALAREHGDRWNKPINALDAGIRAIKDEIERYRASERAAQALALTSATTHEEITQAVEALAPKPAGLSERVAWELVIEDPNQVPREFWILDEKRLAALARVEKERFSVPGCRADRKVIQVFR